MIDYVTLKIIWWAIFCFLVIAFAVTGGRDIGVNFLLLLIGKTDDERRLILNSIGPTWEGNQVWLITLGAGLFAIWPIAYATIFSSMYYAFMLVLVMLILRPPGIDYRGKINSNIWRQTWDIALFCSAAVLALAFGVVIGNFFTGLAFYFSPEIHPIYIGKFFAIFSPFALACGLACFFAVGTQGAIFLHNKLSAPLDLRAMRYAKIFGIGFILTFTAIGLYLCLRMQGYQIVVIPNLDSSFMITNKIVMPSKWWLTNYSNHKILWAFPISTILCTYAAIRLSAYYKPLAALYMHSLAITLAIITAATTLYPFIMPSKINPNHSLTIWDVGSSALTLRWSLLALLMLLPIILAYTTWVYRVMRGKVTLTPESY